MAPSGVAGRTSVGMGARTGTTVTSQHRASRRTPRPVIVESADSGHIEAQSRGKMCEMLHVDQVGLESAHDGLADSFDDGIPLGIFQRPEWKIVDDPGDARLFQYLVLSMPRSPGGRQHMATPTTAFQFPVHSPGIDLGSSHFTGRIAVYDLEQRWQLHLPVPRGTELKSAPVPGHRPGDRPCGTWRSGR